MIYELREYRIQPGCLEEFVRFMDEELVPFQVGLGARALGSFTVPGDPSRYVWIRAFADEKERERVCQAIYQSPEWEQRLLPRSAALSERSGARITPLEPTPGSRRE
ncbi:NIPSNAP family protein [Methylacidimicrobium sp. B4]|uniref:NIPSNAP family protein n=1 Tax=Methylacidimicrobium sp. B4 TaxID=2796139 RepID=UPI001A8CB081|nr:NIPSNAP family protein [Methylacidimicrobium sp. B4]QSR84980.1 NIPSNAP family protein [Methylacidimicrobium sp. B4]